MEGSIYDVSNADIRCGHGSAYERLARRPRGRARKRPARRPCGRACGRANGGKAGHRVCNAERAFDGRTGDDVYGPFARGSGKVGRGNRRAGVEHIVLGGVVFGAFQAIDCGKRAKKEASV